MKESYLEIVELDNGDIVLRPVSEDGEETLPLATLNISDETKSYLKDSYFELAKCMFHAGIDFAYSEEAFFDEGFEHSEEMEELRPKILH
ncbi:hypothetical protein MUS1_09800 [Marinomonas ushuaiensis DSM 15871]|uniref:Uncharacterized protein n=1 Tax=Marinomonas ushuaiensis DSM 15871 TaxID=1122207 RepID=X7E8N2_9GAMM|nr:hypothetical protein [Marinomonas ushuaiensis]ETX11556.1 hypothetical protein MUS1_09800 [Marinomonas ushuaiensis DSM 15871]